MCRYHILNALSDIQHKSTSVMSMQTLQTSHPDPYRCRQTFCAHAHTPRTCDIPVHSPPTPHPCGHHHSNPVAQLMLPPPLPSLPAPPHIMPSPLPSLTWAAVLQDDGQEKVLGEHGARPQPLLPAPSLLTAPPAQPAGLTAWCWAAEKSSSRPLLTRAECLPGKILLRPELTREGPGPPGEGTSRGEKGGCSGDPSPFSHIFSFQSWLPSPNPKSLSHPTAPHPAVITSVPQSGPVLGTPGGSAPWEYPSPAGPCKPRAQTIRVWLQGSQGCLPSPEPAQQFESESGP